MEDSNLGTKLNFTYFIQMALQKKISWETLLVFLDDLTPTLIQSKQAIEVLVKELQKLQSMSGFFQQNRMKSKKIFIEFFFLSIQYGLLIVQHITLAPPSGSA